MLLPITVYKKVVAVFYFCLTVWMLLPSCNSNSVSTNKLVDISNFEFNAPIKSDSVILRECLQSVVRVDSLASETGCSATLKYFDGSNKLRLLKNIQLCISDKRMKWSIETYYTSEEKKVLQISRDGTGKVLEIKRS